MPVRKSIDKNEGLYFITFTCYKWLQLIELASGYDLVYQWFDYLKSCNHRVTAFVIMPNHIHVMIDFFETGKSINKIVGDGKRYIAYGIIERLKEMGSHEILDHLEKAVTKSGNARGKRHEVWNESFDWKRCETLKFAYQKILYINNNPCMGKWKLATEIKAYEHSSARFYISGRHAAYEVVDVENVFFEKLKKESTKNNQG